MAISANKTLLAAISTVFNEIPDDNKPGNLAQFIDYLCANHNAQPLPPDAAKHEIETLEEINRQHTAHTNELQAKIKDLHREKETMIDTIKSLQSQEKTSKPPGLNEEVKKLEKEKEEETPERSGVWFFNL